jgi:arylsulfatase A-like enzyme
MALYDGGVANCDDAFGALMDSLKSRGLYENTIVVLVSDHGEQFFEHGLCDHMNSLYQELLHVPLIIKFPGGEDKGRVVGQMWQHIDIAPTLLHRVGAEIPESMQGVAYLPGGSDGKADRPAYFSLHVGENAAHYGQAEGVARADMDGMRLGSWVLNRTTSTIAFLEPLQLFDLATDPKEQNNLAYTRPEVRVWLASLLKLRSKHDK